jgi:hypothetical protein
LLLFRKAKEDSSFFEKRGKKTFVPGAGGT